MPAEVFAYFIEAAELCCGAAVGGACEAVGGGVDDGGLVEKILRCWGLAWRHARRDRPCERQEEVAVDVLNMVLVASSDTERSSSFEVRR